MDCSTSSFLESGCKQTLRLFPVSNPDGILQDFVLSFQVRSFLSVLRMPLDLSLDSDTFVLFLILYPCSSPVT